MQSLPALTVIGELSAMLFIDDIICTKDLQSKTREANRARFIDKSNYIHNFKYSYDRVIYINARTNVLIYCPVHKSYFEMTPDAHSHGQGCPTCGRQKSMIGRKKTTEEFILEAISIHGNKYKYDKVVYSGAHKHVLIYCPIHDHYFEMTPNNHLQGQGCPRCKFDNNANEKRLSQEEFISLAKQKHGNKYNYDWTVYVNSKTKVTIYCLNHDEFFDQTPANHLFGQGCPKCNHVVSKIGTQWLMSLGIPTLIHEHKIRSTIHNRSFIVDGYDPATNTAYLYHGDYWHGNPKKYDRSQMNTTVGKTMGELYDNTILYESQLRELGLNVISVWES